MTADEYHAAIQVYARESVAELEEHLDKINHPLTATQRLNVQHAIACACARGIVIGGQGMTATFTSPAST